jgi:Nucleotide modification associated domain 2
VKKEIVVKGYIYVTGHGTDPAARQNLNDPLFTRVPTLGACMPNIRRLVFPGDFIFVVSGKVPQVQQYVVGGMRVEEKISMLAAYKRFPENRLHLDANGRVQGNVIVTSKGTQHPLDHHSADTFAERVKNFIVGSDPVALESEREVELGRAQTLPKLSDVLGKRGNRVIDVMSRWAKVDEAQVRDLLSWLQGIKAVAARP